MIISPGQRALVLSLEDHATHGEWEVQELEFVCVKGDEESFIADLSHGRQADAHFIVAARNAILGYEEAIRKTVRAMHYALIYAHDDRTVQKVLSATLQDLGEPI
jgi:hypothetical protein